MNNMFEPRLIDRTLSLAALFQSASLVKQLAHTGRIQEPFFNSCIESLFKIDSQSVPEIYGGNENLQLGLNELIALFSNNKNPKDSDLARYVLSLLHLERKLSKNKEMQQKIQAGIRRAAIQATHFSTTHENVIANLASLYTDTLSTYRFRILITGEPLYFNQSYNLNKIRALFFAGIRAAVLWRQLGGNRWQLLISRHSMIATAKHCLTVPTPVETIL